MHIDRLLSSSALPEPLTGRRKDIYDKVMSRVRIMDGPLDTPCHVWTGPDSGNGRGGGYARMHLDGQTVAVHIVMWVNAHGFIPRKKQLDHICLNRRCVNQEHLQLVTHKRNQKLRSMRKKT